MYFYRHILPCIIRRIKEDDKNSCNAIFRSGNPVNHALLQQIADLMEHCIGWTSNGQIVWGSGLEDVTYIDI